MPSTYEPISTTTLSSSAANITFSSIPSTYTDLVLIFVGKRVSGGNNLYIQVGNGSVDTGASYSRTLLYGNGSAAGSNYTVSASQWADWYVGLSATDDSMHTFNFMNYSNSSTNKTMLWKSNRANEAAQAIVGLWRSTSAINTIKLFTPSSDIASGSTATLYGIKAA